MSKKSRPAERQSPQLQQAILGVWAERQARLGSLIPPLDQSTLLGLRRIRHVALQDPPVEMDLRIVEKVNERGDRTVEAEHDELPQLPSDLALLFEVLDLADDWRARDSAEQRDFQRWREQQDRGERALHLRNVKAQLARGALLEDAEKLRSRPGHRTRSWDEVATILAKEECALDANLDDDEESIARRAKAIKRTIHRARKGRKR